MKNYLFRLSLCVVLLLPQFTRAQFNWPYRIENGVVKTEVPERPAGQQHVLNLKCEKIPVLRVAFVGMGMRGELSVGRWVHQEGV